MQSGKKKREEIQQKYMEKFKTSGVGKQCDAFVVRIIA